MKSLKISLQNCYGIKKLFTELDFSKGNTHIIYAPNGSMKSSLAKVFKDIRDGTIPTDRIFKSRPSTYSIECDQKPIDKNEIVIVDPYLEEFDNGRINTLLASNELKIRYDKINNDIQIVLSDFMSAINEKLKTKGNPAKELYLSMPECNGDLELCLSMLYSLLKDKEVDDFSWIDYPVIFNEKAISFIQNGDIKDLVDEYAKIFNELIEKSNYFRKSGFNHNSAMDVSKDLSSSGFFAANHSIILADTKKNKLEIADQKTFDAVIAKERNALLNDPELKKRFDKIDKAITKNAELKQLRKYLEYNQSLAIELKDIDALRKKIVFSFSKIYFEKLSSYIETFEKGKNEIESIIIDAKKQRTDWEGVVKLFNERFSVPFEIIIQNKEDVILKDETASIAFRYRDNGEEQIIGKDELITVLSIGERRAYHLLNILYEIENRKKLKTFSILIVDDIADSFDYKNKYAIVQYLKDVSKYSGFVQIILSHNFDFYRTIKNRLAVGRGSNCHMTIKEKDEIRLVKAEYLDPFSHYRTKLDKDDMIAIAAIPFIRNISEYAEGDKSANYLRLTALLHIKKETDSILLSEYEIIANKLLYGSYKFKDGSRKVIDIILNSAKMCNDGIESINLEKKIVLSIAIRLLTEKYIVGKLGDSCLDGITSNQTIELIEKYQKANQSDAIKDSIFESVLLMTPENIHLNSFMYEPLLDMSDHHLCELYDLLQTLK